ncbi:MAG: DUF4252 domain-containing protein [Cyclobacteriaceae bacterium]|nr:DUF4252 domain-containing protein [Cyclobacteriaceae bacterium]UYN86113.1 MAG: DUF4252 domain-containing protein [Cyclobacteriaceae bacterium]
MKKIITLLALIVLGTGVYAQSEVVTKFFNKYASDDSFTTQVTISGKMFSLFTNMEVDKPEDKEVLEAISKIKGLRIIGKENTSDARNLYKEASSVILQNKFEELMSVRDKDTDMKFYIIEKGPGKISELIMVSGSQKDFMIMTLFGEIDLKQVSRIGQKMNVSGLDKLEKIDEKGKKKN